MNVNSNEQTVLRFAALAIIHAQGRAKDAIRLLFNMYTHVRPIFVVRLICNYAYTFK